MLIEIRRKYYYPGIVKLVKNGFKSGKSALRTKTITSLSITLELLNLREWDLGPEDAMQIDLLPNRSPSGGYENIITAMDVFSRSFCVPSYRGISHEYRKSPY